MSLSVSQEVRWHSEASASHFRHISIVMYTLVGNILKWNITFIGYHNYDLYGQIFLANPDECLLFRDGALNILMSKSIILVSLHSQRVPLQEGHIE